MRTKNAIYNMIGSLISHFTSMILGFVLQSIFIKNLGTEYLGINGLFNNIFSMLGVVELGIGSSIIYNLYKPVAENDKEKIKSLMSFYKKSYKIIALIILILSIIILPFLNLIVGDVSLSTNFLRIIFLLFMIDIIFSYLLTYKRSILYATQKNYIIDIIHILYLIILNTAHAIILIYTKNYILYLIVKIVMRLLENIVITLYVNKKYDYLKDNKANLDTDTKKEIIKKVKGLFLHKIGTFLVAGTDNIIISTFLGVSTVGLYSNYYMIINAINTVINQIFSSFKSSIGNLIVTSDEEKIYSIFKKMQFLNFWFAFMSSIGILVVMESFITIWVGKSFILAKNVLISLTIYEYVYITKLCISSFKEAGGLFYEDRYIPILESIVNIIASIILINYIGLAGVFIGTILCQLITHIYTYPKIVYKKIFNKNYKQYFIDNYKYAITTIMIAVILYITSNSITLNNDILNCLKNIMLVITIPNLIIIILYRKTDEYKYYVELLKKYISNLKRKKEF